MSKPEPRHGSVFVPGASCMVDPDDRAVKEIAMHVSEITSGLPDWKRVQTALNLVQTGIHYAADSELYGTEEFWARPSEVLYLKHGDCEDTSALFCSIVLAMGLDAVLVDLPGHMAVGVCLGSVPDAPPEASFQHGGKTWWYCETASNEPVGIGERTLKGDYIVREPSDAGIGGAFVSAVAWWRSVIRTATGA